MFVSTAGRDTTAQTLVFVCYLLSQNPRVEAKLLEEIATLGDNEPDFDTVKSLPYLQAVIDETLRIYPPVPYDPKESVKEDVLPNGTVVPQGCQVTWSAYVMGRDEKLWDNPLEFRPERWTGQNGGIPIESINFIPFQNGPRVCLGKAMAYLEVKVVLIMMLRKFRFEHVPNHKVEILPSVTIFAKYGMVMSVHPRKSK